MHAKSKVDKYKEMGGLILLQCIVTFMKNITIQILCGKSFIMIFYYTDKGCWIILNIKSLSISIPCILKFNLIKNNKYYENSEAKNTIK